MKLLRKLPRTSRVLSIAQFYSDKGRCSHYCESIMETHGLLMLEFDDDVISYTTQPFSIKYDFQGRLYRYTPDVLAKYSDDTFKSIEIKPLDKLEQARNKLKFELLRTLFPKELGIPLTILTCADIYMGAQIDNLKWLYPYRQQVLSPHEKEAYRSMPEQLSFELVIERLNGITDTPHHSAMRLVAHNYFSWNKERALLGGTLLTKVGMVS